VEIQENTGFVQLLYTKKEIKKNINYSRLKRGDYFSPLKSMVPLVELDFVPYNLYTMYADGVFTNPATSVTRPPRHGDIIYVYEQEQKGYIMLLVSPDTLTPFAIKKFCAQKSDEYDLALIILKDFFDD
jgi:hypothetical protein